VKIHLSSQDLEKKLAKVVDNKLATELLKEYTLAKRYNFLGDWEKSILHAAKFAELSLATVKNIVDKKPINLNSIRFNNLFNELINKPKNTEMDELLLLIIPHVARTVYDIRNKKRVAHIKSIDPTSLDSQFCVAACNWILSQLICTLLKLDEEKINSLLRSLNEKQIPFVEQFEDGTIVILKDGLTFKEQLLIALYQIGQRIPKKELVSILKAYNQIVHLSVKDLEKKKLVHINEKGVCLTKKGIKFVEDNLLIH